MPDPGRSSKDKPRTTMNASKEANEELTANMDERNNSSDDKEEILGSIRSLKSEFSGRFNGVMTAIKTTRKEVG